jgi:AcrR family transcriptional regulator
MTARVQHAIKPRKMPVQARATVTVDAICEATIQVLLSHGAERLTTTRVAERAGVSIGTLYQYYPNKQSLLFALLTQHLDQISAAVEVACAQARGKPLAEMVQHVVEQFVDAKMRRADISMALYRISAELGGPALAKRTEDRSRKALEAMIRTAPDATSQPEAFAIQMLFSAMAGATRTVLEAGAPPIMVRKLREHLVLLCRCYLGALANARPRD